MRARPTILVPDQFCLHSQARREDEVELTDAAIRTTLSGQANKNEYFNLENSVDTYGGGLAHLQKHTQTDRQTDSYMCLQWLPDLFTSQITDVTIITSASLHT